MKSGENQEKSQNNVGSNGQYRSDAPKRYALGEYFLVPEQRLLSRNGELIHLSPKPFLVLLYLIEQRARVVSRHELLDRFWEGKEVYEDALRKCVGAIRKAFDDHSEKPRFIETRWAEGYRYIGPFAEQSLGNGFHTTESEATRAAQVGSEAVQDSTSVNAPPAPLSATSEAPSQVSGFHRAVLVTIVGIMLALAVVALVFSLSRWGTRKKPEEPIRSVAVLPLKNLTQDPAQEYFSDGVTEHLINTLSKIEGLKVISRGSTFTFKGKEVDPREAGKKLGVATVLEGSVLKRGERVRVEVRLVSAEDGQVLWASDVSDRTLNDIFALQDEIARRTIAGLKIKLSADGERQLAKRYTDNVEAYQAGLKGDYFRNQRTPDGLKKAIESYQQALAKDPRYVPAYLGLVGSYYMGIWYIPLEPKEAAAKSKEAALKALELDNTSSAAHVVMAGLLLLDWNWAGCFREMQRAVELDPGFSDYGYAYQLLLYAGQFDEAVRWIKRAEALDPLSVLVSANVGEILYLARRHDEAIAQCQKTLTLDPNYALAHTHLGLAYVQKGKHEEGIAAFQKAITLSDRNPDLLGRLGHAYAAAGQREEAQQILKELRAIAKQHHVPPYRLAEIYAALGEKDQAFAHLDWAYQAHAMHLCNLKVEPTLDSLRTDPRFADLLRRVGLQ
jgi:TolB-like protein/DNA-binding winged helix-turn-helix (wHTH) protein/Flp pilus assembly protein TadD